MKKINYFEEINDSYIDRIKIKIYKEFCVNKSTEFKSVAKLVLDEFIDNLTKNKLVDWSIEEKTYKVLYFLEQIFDAVSFKTKDKINHNTIKAICIEKYYNSWEEEEYYINIFEVNKVINQYLKCTWFNSPTFEWYLINPYIKYCLDLNKKQFIKENGVPNTSLKRFLFNLGLSALRFIYSFAIPILFITYLFYIEFNLIGFTVFLLFIYRKIYGFLVFFVNRYKINKSMDIIEVVS